MAGTTDYNTKPLYSKDVLCGWDVIATANTAKDGSGTVSTIFTAPSDGPARIEKIKVRAKGTNVATVLRIWINNGSTNATAANNTLFLEQTIASTSGSEVAALADNEIFLNLAIPAGYKVNVTIGTTVSAGLHVSGWGGKY